MCHNGQFGAACRAVNIPPPILQDVMELFQLTWPSKQQQRQSLIPPHLQSRSASAPFSRQQQQQRTSPFAAGGTGIPLLAGRRGSPAVKTFAGRVLGDFGTYLPVSNWRAAASYNRHLQETVLRPLTAAEESRHLERGPTLAAKELNKDYKPRLPSKPGGKEPVIVSEVAKPETTSAALADIASLPRPEDKRVKRLSDVEVEDKKKRAKKTIFD